MPSYGFDQIDAVRHRCQRMKAWEAHYRAKGCSAMKAWCAARKKRNGTWPPGVLAPATHQR